MVHAIMPTETLSREEVQEELYHCYRSFFGSWSRRFRGLFSRKEIKRRTYWYMAAQGIVNQFRKLFWVAISHVPEPISQFRHNISSHYILPRIVSCRNAHSLSAKGTRELSLAKTINWFNFRINLCLWNSGGFFPNMVFKNFWFQKRREAQSPLPCQVCFPRNFLHSARASSWLRELRCSRVSNRR